MANDGGFFDLGDGGDDFELLGVFRTLERECTAPEKDEDGEAGGVPDASGRVADEEASEGKSRLFNAFDQGGEGS